MGTGLGLLLLLLVLPLACGPLPAYMGGAERDNKAAVEKKSSKSEKKTAKAKKSGSSSSKKTASTSSGPKKNIRRAKGLGKTREDGKRKARCQELEPMIREISREYGLEPELVMGVIKVESGFNPEVRSRVGAQGLMQIMPRTGEKSNCSSYLWDPENNIRCGCTVLKKYMKLYDNNSIYGLAAYNAGPGNVNSAAQSNTLPFNFSYVERVLKWRNLFKSNGCM